MKAQTSKRTDETDRQDTIGTPLYRDPAKLNAAWLAGGRTIRGAADELDETYSTVRRWLIEYGIFQPETREPSLAKKLEDASPSDVGRSVDVERRV